MADAQASGACDRKAVRVQVPSPALEKARFYGLFSFPCCISCDTLGVSGDGVLIDLFLFSSVNLRQPAIVFVAKQGDVTKLAGIS